MSLRNLGRAFKKPDKEKERQLKQEIDEFGLEKKDLPAMILSAYIIIIPVVLLVLGIFALAAWLFVR